VFGLEFAHRHHGDGVDWLFRWHPTGSHHWGKRYLGIMPAVADETMGLKLVCFYPGNAGTSVPTHTAVILLFRPETGEPLAVMDGRCAPQQCRRLSQTGWLHPTAECWLCSAAGYRRRLTLKRSGRSVQYNN